LTQASAGKKFWNYLGECSRLLYWAYFKPLTLNRWLQEIHPDLNPYMSPFAMQAEFANNPRLYRYANQVWWLIAVVPLLAVLLVAPIYSLSSRQTFNWLGSGLFLLGWLVGLWIARGNNEKSSKRILQWFKVIFIFIFILISLFLLIVFSRFVHEADRLLLQTFYILVDILSNVGQIWPFAFGVALGVAFGLALGVAFSVAWVLGTLRVYFWFRC